MKTLRDELNECILDMQANADKMKTLLMRDDIVWPEMEGPELCNGDMFMNCARWKTLAFGCSDCPHYHKDNE